MARKEDARERVYNLPENFIEGGRIFNGMFKARNFVEAVILALIFGLIAFMLPIKSTYTRITVVLFMVLPPFFFGITGINGDPLFTFFRNAWRWKKTRGIMVYDTSIKAVKKTPLDAMLEEPIAKDKIVGAVESWREKKRVIEEQRRQNIVYEFEEDTEISRLKNNSVQKNRKKHSTNQQGHEEPPAFEDYTNPSADDGTNFFFGYDGSETK